MESQSWLFFGAGAIGTYIGGSLALQTQAGKARHRVVFIERPEVAAQVRNQGLRLNLGGVEYLLPEPQVCTSLEEALAMNSYDIAVFALKSYDTRPALQELVPFTDRLPPFLCLQNGVENETALAERLGQDRVIAGTVTSAVGRIGPGDIHLERLRGMGVAAGHALSARITEALVEAGLNARLYPRAEDMKWSKMLTNLLANASAAILDMSPGEVFNHSAAYRLEVASQREALRVMRGLGYRIVDLPGIPVRLLAFGMKYLPPSLSRPLLKRFAGKGRGEKMPSLHIDLHAGRKQSEVDYLNGAVVRFGKKLGIPTPVNQTLNEVLLKLVQGEIRLEEYAKKPGKLLGLVST
jgi:2-dehydropantoate 2-reductase